MRVHIHLTVTTDDGCIVGVRDAKFEISIIDGNFSLAELLKKETFKEKDPLKELLLKK